MKISHAADVAIHYPRVTLEEMAALHPEVILLSDEPYAFSQADSADFMPFPEVPAAP